MGSGTSAGLSMRVWTTYICTLAIPSLQRHNYLQLRGHRSNKTEALAAGVCLTVPCGIEPCLQGAIDKCAEAYPPCLHRRQETGLFHQLLSVCIVFLQQCSPMKTLSKCILWAEVRELTCTHDVPMSKAA